MRLLTCLLGVNYILAGTAASNGQEKRTGYVDLHAHTTLKLFNQQDDLAQKDSLANWRTPAIENIRGEMSSNFQRTQCDYNRIASTDYSLVLQSFCPVEKGHLDSRMKQRIARLGKMKHIGKLHSHTYSTFKAFNDEYAFQARQAVTTPNHTRQLVVATDSSHLRQLLAQGNVVPIVNTIEGLHPLMGDTIAWHNRHMGYSSNPDHNLRVIKEELLHNLDSIRMLPTRIFFVALTHHTWDYIAGQARYFDKNEKIFLGLRMRRVIQWLTFTREGKKDYSNKHGVGLIDTLLPTDSLLFYSTNCKCYTSHPHRVANACFPVGRKYDIGHRVVDSLLSRNNRYGKPIYIDVKHMDIQARHEYLDIVKRRRALGDTIPIIASHTAVSGKNERLAAITGLPPLFDDYREVKDPQCFYKRHKIRKLRKCPEFTDPAIFNNPNSGWFYPFSLNLYDEEIEEIYNSDGIMGVILDERLLGAYMKNYRKRSYKKAVRVALKDSTEEQRRQYREIVPFLRNLVYIVEHSGRLDTLRWGHSAWDHIGIGSDFDGLIDPVDECKTSDEFPHFEKLVRTYLPVYLGLEGKEDLLLGLTPEQITEKVFRTNSYNFVLKYF